MSAEVIRPALAEDARRISEIYRPYVTDTAITFDVEAPDEAAFALRIAEISQGYPFFVSEIEGRVVAYAYAHAYKPRAAYDPTVELSVYTDRNFLGRGIGRRLTVHLLEALKKDARRYTAIANITSPNERSERMFRSLGFQKCSEFRFVGRKFGAWQTVCDYILPLKPYADAND